MGSGSAHVHNIEQTNDGLVLLLTRIFIVVGGVLPFIPQYIQIYRTGSASGFSTYLCLVVISSNSLRIAYWFGHWFDNALLAQSIIMTFVMLLLVEICLRVERRRAENEGRHFEEVSIMDLRMDKIWQWTDIWSYILASIILTAVAVAYTSVLKDHAYLIEPVGFIALILESALAVPQIIKNYQAQSTKGMNFYMVILWTIGDASKAFFFFQTAQPLPFQICAVLQLSLNFILFTQIAYYWNSG